jgi:hypothetical protein
MGLAVRMICAIYVILRDRYITSGGEVFTEEMH